MAANLAKMSDKELVKLETDVAKEMKSRAKRKLQDARKAAEAAAKKHGFSLNDVFGGGKVARAKKAPQPAKFKNPNKPSQTWSGRGRQPAWYKDAIAKGTDPKKLAV